MSLPCNGLKARRYITPSTTTITAASKRFAASPTPAPIAANGESTAPPRIPNPPKTRNKTPTIKDAHGATDTMKSFPPFGRDGAFANHESKALISPSTDVCAILYSPPLPRQSVNEGGLRSL